MSQLRARLRDALADHYKLGEYDYSDRPGAKRKHIFDHPDGTRLIISRETLGTCQQVIHVSGSVDPRMMPRESLRTFNSQPADWVAGHFAELLGRACEPTDRAMSEGGVVHLLFSTDIVQDDKARAG
jgi:hypothetical protein